MFLLILGLVLFLGLHSLRIVAPGVRQSLVERLGEGPWKIVHSLASIASLCLLIYGFAVARATTPVVWDPPVWTRHIALLLMIPAMICLVASLMPAGRIKEKVKFPLIVATKTWALAHLIANGELSSILLFGSFLVWLVVLRISLKRRIAAGTTVLPVFVSGRYDLIAIVGGLGLWTWMIFGLHEWLIGVPPLVF